MTKVCTSCHEEKPLDAFSKRTQQGKVYLRSSCKACLAEKSRVWRRTSEAKQRSRLGCLTRKGISQEQYDAQLLAQGGRCAICRSDNPGKGYENWQIDHDHSCCTGCDKCLRGLLCANCNKGLGFFLDEPERLSAAIYYLGADPRFGLPPAIDALHLAHQRAWSLRTFGPGRRTAGIVDHIRRELDEILDEPADLGEWVDVIILGFDGAYRAGHEPQSIIDAIKAKQAKNELREWPDWRTVPQDRAIEHVKGKHD